MKYNNFMHLIEDAIKTAREEHVTVELNNSLFEGVGSPEEILEGMLHQEEGVPSPTETEACRQESLGQRVVIVFVGYGKRSWKILRGALFSDDTYWLCKGINKKAKIPIDKPWEEDLVMPLITWGISLTFICGVAATHHSQFFAIAAIILGIICLIGIWTLLQQRKELRQQQKELRRLNWMLKIERQERKKIKRWMKNQLIHPLHGMPQQPLNISINTMNGDIIGNRGLKNETFITNKQRKNDFQYNKL